MECMTTSVSDMPALTINQESKGTSLQKTKSDLLESVTPRITPEKQRLIIRPLVLSLINFLLVSSLIGC